MTKTGARGTAKKKPAVAASLREELKREDGLEFCRIVSRRVVLEFTRIIPEPEDDEERSSMVTELHEGDVVVILRGHGRRETEGEA